MSQSSDEESDHYEDWNEDIYTRSEICCVCSKYHKTYYTFKIVGLEPMYTCLNHVTEFAKHVSPVSTPTYKYFSVKGTTRELYLFDTVDQLVSWKEQHQSLVSFQFGIYLDRVIPHDLQEALYSLFQNKPTITRDFSFNSLVQQSCSCFMSEDIQFIVWRGHEPNADNTNQEVMDKFWVRFDFRTDDRLLPASAVSPQRTQDLNEMKDMVTNLVTNKPRYAVNDVDYDVDERRLKEIKTRIIVLTKVYDYIHQETLTNVPFCLMYKEPNQVALRVKSVKYGRYFCYPDQMWKEQTFVFSTWEEFQTHQSFCYDIYDVEEWINHDSPYVKISSAQACNNYIQMYQRLLNLIEQNKQGLGNKPIDDRSHTRHKISALRVKEEQFDFKVYH